MVSSASTVTTDGPTREVGAAVPVGEMSMRPGSQIGRYVVERTIARGGMGEVLLARDPELERRVAIKRVRTDLMREDAQARLAREARAMARLNHRNVVAIYSVDAREDAVYITMEYVAGGTFGEWLKQERSWVEIVEAFREAARGLAAAHAAGFVHRDFKLGNVLRTEAGEIKVTDFGLARLADSVDAPASVRDSHVSPSDPSSLGESEGLTVDGSVIGTPRYMAPEQHLGERLDPRADQFALCVALWRALTREFPYPVDDLVASKLRGPPPFPADTPVPRRIVRAIRRGLASAPRDRWPSLDPLIDVLDPHRRPLGKWLVVGGGGLALAGVAFASAAGERAPACQTPDELLASAWGAEQQRAVSEVLASLGEKGADAWVRVGPQIDAYAESWRSTYAQACEARGDSDRTAADLDAQFQCLGEARVRLAATAHLLSKADEEVVDQIDRLVGGLLPLARCTDLDRLRADVPTPEDETAAAEVAAIREALQEATAQNAAGKYTEALATLESLHARARRVAFAPLEAQVLVARGESRMELGQYEPAVSDFERAYDLAAEHGPIRTALVAAERYAFVAGSRLAKFEDAERMARIALALSERVGLVGHLAAVHSTLASIAHSGGDLESARHHMEESLRYMREDPTQSRRNLALGHRNLGVTLMAIGRYDEAAASLETAVEEASAALPAGHDDIDSHRAALAACLGELGRNDEAEAILLDVLSRADTETNIDSSAPGVMRNSLGLVYASRGDHDKARTQFEQSIALLTAAVGRETPLVAKTQANLASTLRSLGELEEAARVARDGLRTTERLHGFQHPDVAAFRINLSAILQDQGRFEQSEFEARGALELAIAVLGREHNRTALSHHRLGESLLAQDRTAEAIEHMNEACAIYRALPPGDEQGGQAMFALAKVLWEHGGDRARAVALAREAVAWFDGRGPDSARLGDAARTWLETTASE